MVFSAGRELVKTNAAEFTKVGKITFHASSWKKKASSKTTKKASSPVPRNDTAFRASLALPKTQSLAIRPSLAT